MALIESFPWAKKPLIINAPMAGSAGSDLAIAVSAAGGLGQIGSDMDMKKLDDQLAQVERTLPRYGDLLPVGVGFLVFVTKLDEAIDVLRRRRPAVVWLFAAPQLDEYTQWTNRVRQASPNSQIWIQVGNVSAAVEVAKNCRPDVLCAQGADAGGHGFDQGAGIISLLPEIIKALDAHGLGSISVVAAGGISEGHAAAAAFALGAQGVVMGTRFLSAPETRIHPLWQSAILAARDGGKQTVRSKLFDNLRGPSIWPQMYDGRAIIMESYVDHMNGVSIEEIRQRYSEAAHGPNAGFGQDGKGRAAMWAGTGIGHVDKIQPAAEIVEDVRSSVKHILNGLQALL